MATVNVEIYGPFAELAGTRHAKVELGEANIKGLIEAMKKSWGRAFTDSILEESGEEFNLSVLVLVNHQPVYHLHGLQTELKDGDTIVFIPPAAGGISST
jgi:molybdopterin synthase sulfur carrier subunit